MDDSWVMTDAGLEFLIKENPGVAAKIVVTEIGKLMILPACVVLVIVTIGTILCARQMHKNKIKGEKEKTL